MIAANLARFILGLAKSITIIALVTMVAGSTLAIAQDVSVLSVQYLPDKPFPEYQCFWNDLGYPNNCGTSSPMGASVHAFLKNNSAVTVTLQDVQLSGISLKTALTLMTNQTQVAPTQPASIYLSQAAGLITTTQLNTLVSAGEPVWYKIEPSILPPGGTAQIVVRLRQTPTATANLNVIHTAGTSTVSVPVQPNQPVLAGISFSSDLTKVYMYWRHTLAGQAPTQVLMDGVNVTANVTTQTDATMTLVPSILQLPAPLSNGEFHVYSGVFADGQTATAGVRAWNNEFIYGIWGAAPGTADQVDVAKAYLDDISSHLISTVVQTLGSQAVQTFLKSTEGQAYAANRGLGFVIDAPNKWWVANPRLYFVRDEPDCLDPNVTGLTTDQKPGVIAQWCLQYASTYLGLGNQTATLNLLNIDNQYKPYNFYNYGQLPDVMCTDPYYQIRLRRAYWESAIRIPLYAKATYIYAMAQTAKASSEPNPLHVVLYSCSYVEPTRSWPFPTPQCKRIEAYYALAAGAKGMSYWWYTPQLPTYTAYGVGAARLYNDADAKALWNEIAMVGAETRTAGPVIVRSTPANLSIQSTPGLWVRSLIAGQDTIVLLVVNDNYTNLDTGIQFTPVANASTAVTLPTWLNSPTAFEITRHGTRDVGTQINGKQMSVDLGPVGVTRMIVITSDAQLRASLQSRYEQQYQSKVLAITGEVGACCIPNGGGSTTCVVTSQGECANNLKGYFKGAGTTCSTNGCGPRADFDNDLDVDQSDFGRMQECLGINDVSTTVPDCVYTDLNTDDKIDYTDLLIFQDFISGPNLPSLLD